MRLPPAPARARARPASRCSRTGRYRTPSSGCRPRARRSAAGARRVALRSEPDPTSHPRTRGGVVRDGRMERSRGTGDPERGAVARSGRDQYRHEDQNAPHVHPPPRVAPRLAGAANRVAHSLDWRPARVNYSPVIALRRSPRIRATRAPALVGWLPEAAMQRIQALLSCAVLGLAVGVPAPALAQCTQEFTMATCASSDVVIDELNVVSVVDPCTSYADSAQV